MGTIIAIIVAMVIAVLSPIAVTALAHGTLSKLRKRHAKERFDAEPYCREGIILSEIRLGGSDKQVASRCYIYSIALGRIEIRLIHDDDVEMGFAMSWTLVEYEGFDPVVELNRLGNPVYKISGDKQ